VIGIPTSGGDCPGWNAVICSVAKPVEKTCAVDILSFSSSFSAQIRKSVAAVKEANAALKSARADADLTALDALIS
jgi:6-phosphofructokinase